MEELEHKVEIEKVRKIALALLIVLGLTGLTLGFFYIRQNLTLATAIPKSATNQATFEAMAELQTKDTDKDGLSDYEELYIYNTSPYLEDSDSDEISDKIEISSGEDPNCPKGQNCLEESAVTSPYEETPRAETTVPEAVPPLIDEAYLNSMTPAQLRDLLKQSGLSDEILNNISDDDLQSLYQETLSEIKKNSATAE